MHNTNLNPLALSSINAEHRNLHTTTDQYKHISTKRVLDIVADFGWFPVASNQAKVRKGNEFKEGFQKHAVKLENNFYRDALEGLAKPQMLLRHSHDGSSSFQFLLALYVFLCSNGAISYDDVVEQIRVLHRGFTEEKLEAAIAAFVQRIPLLTNQVVAFKNTLVDRQEQLLLAQSAIELRFNPITDAYGVPIKQPDTALKGIAENLYPVAPTQILNVRRSGDTTQNLWGVFNVIQENIVERPIAKASSVNLQTGRVRRTRMRPVAGIDANTKLNQGLWAMASKFAALKNGIAPVAALVQ